MKVYLLVIVVFLLTSCQERNIPAKRQVGDHPDTIYSAAHNIGFLNTVKHAPRAGEWLYAYKETYQPYAFYIREKPTRATGKRTTLYTIRIGHFDSGAIKIYQKSGEYLAAFFQIATKDLGTIPVSSIPERHTRSGYGYGSQLESRFIIDSVLPQLLPDDAFALIAFCSNDLYPEDSWNFVFGQASLEKRVGVWSLARLGDYNKNDSMFRLCQFRTLHVAAHETGHMFGVTHCTQYECCMNGSNSLEESDAQPAWLCWECMAKLCWNRDVAPETHLWGLWAFHKKYTKDSGCISYYAKAIEAMGHK